MNIEKIVAKGGATISMNGAKIPKTGYMVSLYGTEHKIPVSHGESQMLIRTLRYIGEMCEELARKEHFLGIWVHDDEMYLDVSVRFKNEALANAFAFKNRQKAYFDLKDKVVIDVDEFKAVEIIHGR